MSGTMTWVGFDVHARSTHGAAIDTMTGELTRMRFGPGVVGPVAWLAELPGPVKACYEAGPIGFGLSHRAQQRLHKVNRTMKARGKPHNVTVVACARQLAGFLWAAATAD